MSYLGFFNDATYQVVDGNIVYASDLNNPMAALETGIASLVSCIQTGATIKTATDTGVVNAYVMSLTAAPATLVDGQEAWLIPTITNTGAATLNLNSFGAKAIRTVVRTALVGGELLAGYPFLLKYVAAFDAWLIASDPGATAYDNSKTLAGIEGITVTSDDTTIIHKITDLGVSTAKLAAEAVTQEKIAPSVSFGSKAIQVFTSNGTYTPTAGCTVALVELVGGGGSGGGSGGGFNHSGGGGAGGYSRKRISLSGITTETVTVGAGGIAVSGASNGNTGGTSSFGSHCSATGGSGGLTLANGADRTGAAGGAGTGGDINISGGSGGTYLGRTGGASFFGGGRKRGTTTGAYGAGGEGAYENPAEYTSAAGVGGIVIVTEY